MLCREKTQTATGTLKWVEILHLSEMSLLFTFIQILTRDVLRWEHFTYRFPRKESNTSKDITLGSLLLFHLKFKK